MRVTAVGTVTALVVIANVFVVGPGRHRHGGRHRGCIGVTARQRDNRTARRGRGTKRDGTGAVDAARHRRRIHGHSVQSRWIHGQRRGLGHAAVSGGDGHYPRTVATAWVVIAKVAVVALAATVTEAGTVAAFSVLLASVDDRRRPPARRLVSVTVPVLPAPPVTAVGLTLTSASAAGPADSPSALRSWPRRCRWP